MIINLVLTLLSLTIIVAGIIALHKGLEKPKDDANDDVKKDKEKIKYYGGILVTIGALSLCYALWEWYSGHHSHDISDNDKPLTSFGFRFY